MTEKKSILLLASAATLTFALQESAMSSPPANEAATPPPAATTEPAPPKASEALTPAAAPSAQGSAGMPAPAPAPASPRTAITASPELSPPPIPPLQPPPVPETPPGFPGWSSAGAPVAPEPPQFTAPEAGESRSAGLTAEERFDQRQQRFKEMRERVVKRHQEMTARWDGYWKILDAMTPEQKEAVEAVYGAGRKHCKHRSAGRSMHRGATMPPRFGQPQRGFPSGSAFPGPGYGSPDGEPLPFDRGPASSWFGEQQMPPAGYQPPWIGSGQNRLQGPPPPGGDQPQP